MAWNGKVGLIMVYEWKDGTRGSVSKHDANIIGPYLVEYVTKTGSGGLIERLYLEAKNKQCPLHSMLQWDDEKAAESFRRQQIAYIVRSIETGDRRAIVSVRTPNQQKYNYSFAMREDSRSDRNYRKEVVKQALDRLESWCKEYGDLIELSSLLVAIKNSWPHGDGLMKRYLTAMRSGAELAAKSASPMAGSEMLDTI